MRRGRAIGSKRVVRRVVSFWLAHASGIIGPEQREGPSARRLECTASRRATRVLRPPVGSGASGEATLSRPRSHKAAIHKWVPVHIDPPVNHRSPPARHRLAGEGMGLFYEGVEGRG